MSDRLIGAAAPCHICKRPLNEPGELWCSAGHSLPPVSDAEDTIRLYAEYIRDAPDEWTPAFTEAMSAAIWSGFWRGFCALGWHCRTCSIFGASCCSCGAAVPGEDTPKP